MEKQKSTLKYEALLLLTAMIWGSGFIAQRLGMDSVPPITFNALRFFIGGLVLIPIIALKKTKLAAIKKVILPGIGAGVLLFFASNLQQFGILYTTVSKAGFITGLYVAFVPLFAFLLFKKKTALSSWIGAIVCVVGLYVLAFSGNGEVNIGDLILLASAFFWTFHVLYLDKWSPQVDSLVLASVQFFACAVLNFLFSFIFEKPTLASINNGILPILYSGFLAVGVGYTLQSVAQSKAHPARASIIMSLEAPFASLFSVLFLREQLSLKEYIGCFLMLTGAVVAQLPQKTSKSETQKNS